MVHKRISNYISITVDKELQNYINKKKKEFGESTSKTLRKIIREWIAFKKEKYNNERARDAIETITREKVKEEDNG